MKDTKCQKKKICARQNPYISSFQDTVTMYNRSLLPVDQIFEWIMFHQRCLSWPPPRSAQVERQDKRIPPGPGYQPLPGPGRAMGHTPPRQALVFNSDRALVFICRKTTWFCFSAVARTSESHRSALNWLPRSLKSPSCTVPPTLGWPMHTPLLLAHTAQLTICNNLGHMKLKGTISVK